MRWSDSDNGAQHGYIQDKASPDVNHMGGPHPNASPVVWADGHVSNYPYMYANGSLNGTALTDDATWQSFWAYNRSWVLQEP
jgi:prepilin-type processing-associated H-X9-DG protein